MAIKTNKQAGFTLIEVLVALTITFLFSTALFSGYRTALINADRTTWSMQNTEDRQLCISQIEASIMANLKSGQCNISGKHHTWEVVSEGRHETVRGLNPATLTIDYTGLYIVTYSIEVKDRFNAPFISFEIKIPA